MQDPPTPFYSRTGTRTRPTRRRTEFDTPDLGRFRRELSRGTLVIAAFITLLTIGSAAIVRSKWQASHPPPVVASSDAVSVRVSRVIDGDTLEVRAAETPLRVRLYGVDTPERGERCADEATARLAALAGDRVLLVPDARPTDQYGRELRYVFTADGQSIDALLVSEGLAHAWRQDGNRRDAIVATEERARASKTGCLWAK